ncbi:transketolase [Actinophytocola algeriensis]|uniref:Transketolase n=1 Tax=Actinophytocola algeriensis TaxID=1768010 RepID=A0A7W7VCM8_9PSEU|nr:transketolase [Actinophytocola algeriensis]MBB4905296.1 transketolase [Actinophytocola algeriensis]MBE1473019.1 transketolase [Actinophytocola algeriensis]
MSVEALAEPSPVGDLVGLHRTALAVREHILAMGAGAVGTHVGGSLSAVDILVALYREVLRVRPDEPGWPDRDHFILSKGHASAALYATLAECGFFPVEELGTYGRAGGRLMAHPTPAVPGVEFATGSLGHGLALGAGLALAAKRAGRDKRVFVLMGDGELQEGSVWEAAMAAAHHELDNLTAIVDRNRLQISGSTEDRLRLEPLADKWRAFGWQTSEVDGHDFAQLVPALRTPPSAGGPAVLIADTVKGRGVRHLQHRKQSHFAKLGPEAYERAVTALRAAA